MFVQSVNNTQNNTTFGFKIRFRDPELKAKILTSISDVRNAEDIFNKALAHKPEQTVEIGYACGMFFAHNNKQVLSYNKSKNDDLGACFCKFLKYLIEPDREGFWGENWSTVFERLKKHNLFNI